MTTPTPKASTQLNFQLALFVFLILATLAPAQQVAPTTQSAIAGSREGEITELNPFVITAGADEGYAPTETLSGTRLKTAAKDVASAMSIVSADMLSDLGALNYNDVVDFLPSTSHHQQNEADPNSDAQRTSTPFIVRGFQSTTILTDFFSTLTPIDIYNTNRLTFSRGANSVLFSVGNPGGGIDISSNRPALNRTFHSVAMRADSFGSYRISTDSNIALIPKKLGLRVDLLQEDRRTAVKPETGNRGSAFLATTYKPLEGTTLTLVGEYTRIRSIIPRTVITLDQYTPWVLAGSPLKATYGDRVATTGLEFNNTTGYLVTLEGQSALETMNWKSSALGSRFLVNGVLDSNVSFSTPSVVPLYTNIGGQGDRIGKDDQNVSFFWQQRIGRKLFVEVAGKYEHQFLDNWNRFSQPDQLVRVDANSQLPNGQPNPYAGMPYVDSRNSFHMMQDLTTQQGRAAATYEFNFDRPRLFDRGLGKITFSALANYARSQEELDDGQEVNMTPLLTTGTFGRLDNVVNNIHRRYYLVPGSSHYFTSDYAPINSGGVHSGFARVRIPPRDNVSVTKSLAFTMQADLLDNLIVGTFGVRNDDIHQETATYVRDALGVFPDPSQRSGTLTSDVSGRTYTAGVVLNATKRFSLFANKATNFQPGNQSRITINGAVPDNAEGGGYDVGIKFNIFGSKLQGSIGKFETTQSNLVDLALNGRKTTAIAAIWNTIDLNRAPDVTWIDTKKVGTEGYEFQLVGNPTRNLRLMVTASKNITTLQDRGAELFAYVEKNLPEWQANAAAPVISTLGATVGALTQIITGDIKNDKLLIGRPQTNVSKWQFSGVARYKFAGVPRLKDVAVGSSFYWRDEPVIGFKVQPGTTNFDITQPFKGAKIFNVDAWIDYTRLIMHKRFRWDTQLRVQNLLDTRDTVPWTAVDDGTGGRFVEFRLRPRAIGVSLSTSFSF